MRPLPTSAAWRVLALLLVTATPVALRSSAAQVPAPPQPVSPRDAAPAANGTATIVGRVTNLETGKPLRRALIRIASPALPPKPEQPAAGH